MRLLEWKRVSWRNVGSACACSVVDAVLRKGSIEKKYPVGLVGQIILPGLMGVLITHSRETYQTSKMRWDRGICHGSCHCWSLGRAGFARGALSFRLRFRSFSTLWDQQKTGWRCEWTYKHIQYIYITRYYTASKIDYWSSTRRVCLLCFTGWFSCRKYQLTIPQPKSNHAIHR